MPCSRYRESVHELVDGTIGPIRGADASLAPIEPPARVWLQVAGRLRQEGRVRPLPGTRLTPARSTRHGVLLAIAAVLLMAVGASIAMLVSRMATNTPASLPTADTDA